MRRSAFEGDSGPYRSAILLLASVGMATLALTTACHRQAERGEVPSRTRSPASQSSPPPQHLAQVYIIGIQEVSEAIPDGQDPAAGVRFHRGALGPNIPTSRLVPCTEPRTVAGLTMPAEEFLTWMKELEQARGVTLLLAARFAVRADQPSEASNTGTTPHIANWTLDRTGACTAELADLCSGTTLSLAPSSTADPRVRLLHIDVRMSRGELKKWMVIEGFRSDKSGSAPPLEIELPNEAIQHLRIAVPAERGRATILAHYMRQQRSATTNLRSSQDVRQHVLYVVTTTSSSPEPRRAARSEPQRKGEHHSATFFWCQNLADRSVGISESQSGSEASCTVARKVSPEELVRALRAMIGQRSQGNLAARKRLQEKHGDSRELSLLPPALGVTEEPRGPVLHSLGVALVPGRPVTFEVGHTSAYVTGITPKPEPEVQGPYRFAIEKARSGIEIETALQQTPDGMLLRLNARLGDQIRLNTVSEAQSTVRAVSSSGISETHHLSTCDQKVAELAAEITVGRGGTWELTLPWRDRNAGLQAGPTGAGGSALLTLRCPS